MTQVQKIKSAGIPRDWNLSAEWITQVLQPHHPGVEVRHIKRIGGDDGTSSRAVFELDYAAGEGPKTLFAKTKGNPLRRLFQWMSENHFIEGNLVASGIDLPLEHPRFYYGAVDRLRMNDMIIMEDVGPRGAVLNDATKPVSVDAVANGLRGLARMHSQYWGFTTESMPALDWVKPWRASRTFRFLMNLGCSRGLPRLQAHLPEQVVALGHKGLVDYWVRHVRSASHGPATLLHGDAHVGNTYLLPDGTLGFFDWGVMRRGHWSFDVTYFIISALEEDQRRQHAEELVEVYRQALELPDSERPSREEAWLRFRSATPYGLAIWICTGAEDDYQKPAICQNLSRRFGSAFVDLDTPAALDSLGY